MILTIADRIRQSAVRGFIGRARELEALTTAVAADELPFLVAFVHGPGGIGKSRLVRQLLATLPSPARGLYLDGRDVEPTPAGFCRAVAQALDLPGAQADPVTIATELGRSRSVLVIDTYEVLGLLDTWLRTRFLPPLPATTLTILAGRDRPARVWHTSAGWSSLMAEFSISSLSPDESRQLLRHRGLNVAQAEWANAFARGHPLALELAAAAVRADASCVEGHPVAPAGLLESFLGQLPADTIESIEAAATVRRVTAPVLAAVLGNAGDGFDALRTLPFVEEAGDGLLLHDVVRDTVNHDLAMRDPDRRREYRRRAVRHVADRGQAAGADPWEHTADLMFLIENPVLRDACFPSVRPGHCVEPATSRDHPAIREIVTRHESSSAAESIGHWLNCHPGTFSVARDPDGAVAAFVQIMDLSEVDPRLMTVDPVAAAWRTHLGTQPPSPDDVILVMRRWLGRDSGASRHLSNVFGKLGIHTRAEAARIAAEHGFTAASS